VCVCLSDNTTQTAINLRMERGKGCWAALNFVSRGINEMNDDSQVIGSVTMEEWW